MGFAGNAVRFLFMGGALFLTVIITALIGNAIAIRVGGSPSAINYCMFVAVLSWLTIIFGVVTTLVVQSLEGFTAIAEAVTAVFSLIAGLVLAAKLGVHSCGNANYREHNSLIAGSTDQSRRCHELQASCAFFWFLFALYAASAALGFLSNGSSGLSSRVGMRKGPSMSQV